MKKFAELKEIENLLFKKGFFDKARCRYPKCKVFSLAAKVFMSVKSDEREIQTISTTKFIFGCNLNPHHAYTSTSQAKSYFSQSGRTD